MRAAEDPLLDRLDGRAHKLVPRLRQARRGSPVGVIREQRADRLNITEEELYRLPLRQPLAAVVGPLLGPAQIRSA